MTRLEWKRTVLLLIVWLLAVLGAACNQRQGADEPQIMTPKMEIPKPKARDTEPEPPLDREQYELLDENPFHLVADEPLSTFSIDVDTAGYANVRRMIRQGELPPVDAVRIEEMINCFRYAYPEPEGVEPFSVSSEVASCPWQPEHRLVRLGLKARDIDWTDRPASNLVFLLDVSGSMNSPNKLPLVKKAIKMLVETLGSGDRVAIVAYAGAAGLVLDSTHCDDELTILEALEQLEAGGSTAGGAGIELAYQVAERNFIEGGLNRVILGTDGDFNVGITDQGSLVRLIREKAKSGVFLTVLGFGMGNLQDSTLEKLADQGNGNYGYIDSELEARKLLVQEAGGTMITVAKDVKIQVEFNPVQVHAFRLIGYENRLLAHQDFADDTKDAGEIGAGHTVTALYEVVPAGVDLEMPGAEPLRYQRPAELADVADSGELLFVKLRYKLPDEDTSTLISVPVVDEGLAFDVASDDLHLAAGVAAFGMLLRDSQYRGAADFDLASELIAKGSAYDPNGYRTELAELVTEAQQLGER
ncbi:MAG: von Willebrand factor type A domain-containing protein [Acidobacteriota bacterium]